MLPVTVARSSSDGVAMCYVLPVLRITSCFHIMEPIGGRTGTALCTIARRLPLAENRSLWVGRPASSKAVFLPRWPRTRDVARATALQSTGGASQRLLKQSAVTTIDAASIRCGCVAACVQKKFAIRTSVFGPVHQNVAPRAGAKSAVFLICRVYDTCIATYVPIVSGEMRSC